MKQSFFVFKNHRVILMVKQSCYNRLETNTSEKCENQLSVKGPVLKSSAH